MHGWCIRGLDRGGQRLGFAAVEQQRVGHPNHRRTEQHQEGGKDDPDGSQATHGGEDNRVGNRVHAPPGSPSLTGSQGSMLCPNTSR